MLRLSFFQIGQKSLIVNWRAVGKSLTLEMYARHNATPPFCLLGVGAMQYSGCVGFLRCHCFPNSPRKVPIICPCLCVVRIWHAQPRCPAWLVRIKIQCRHKRPSCFGCFTKSTARFFQPAWLRGRFDEGICSCRCSLLLENHGAGWIRHFARRRIRHSIRSIGRSWPILRQCFSSLLLLFEDGGKVRRRVFSFEGKFRFICFYCEVECNTGNQKAVWKFSDGLLLCV